MKSESVPFITCMSVSAPLVSWEHIASTQIHARNFHVEMVAHAFPEETNISASVYQDLLDSIVMINIHVIRIHVCIMESAN